MSDLRFAEWEINYLIHTHTHTVRLKWQMNDIRLAVIKQKDYLRA